MNPNRSSPHTDVPILFEDNHLLVVEKPVNMPTQEDESRDMDLLTFLKNDIKVRYGKPGNVYLGLVHRLDRPVGGVMVFAKTSKAASRLSDLIRTRQFRKTYLAVIHGKPAQPSGRLIHYVRKDEKRNIVQTVDKRAAGAKEAILDYTVLGTGEGFSLVQIELHTGRPHQIRVQFAAIGCPLYGDQKYGIGVNQVGQQIALWSHSVSFMHPTLKEELTFRSVPPNVHPWFLWDSIISSKKG
jgi:23S rRNA pseudouridine1911/1915/1917 synthase